jgi:ABC-type antimicrobial peptide transport system permease subunit
VFVLPFSTPIHLEVVGIVGDVRDYGPASEGLPPFYMSSRQLTPSTMRFVVRTHGDPTALAQALRSAVLEVEPGAAVYDIGTMKERMASATSSSDLGTFLLSVFAVVALALAAAGLYGVMACFVTERQREIGIRSALGAAPQAILGWVVGRGAAIAAVGLVLGVVLAFPASRLIRSLLFATSPTDLPALTGAALTLAVAVLAACAVPAVRAARSDPSTALRAQ